MRKKNPFKQIKKSGKKIVKIMQKIHKKKSKTPADTELMQKGLAILEEAAKPIKKPGKSKRK